MKGVISGTILLNTQEKTPHQWWEEEGVDVKWNGPL